MLSLLHPPRFEFKVAVKNYLEVVKIIGSASRPPPLPPCKTFCTPRSSHDPLLLTVKLQGGLGLQLQLLLNQDFCCKISCMLWSQFYLQTIYFQLICHDSSKPSVHSIPRVITSVHIGNFIALVPKVLV